MILDSLNLKLLISSKHTVKPVLSCCLKIDKTKVFKPCGSLKQVKSTAECSMGAFCNTLTCIKRMLVLKTYCFGLF